MYSHLSLRLSQVQARMKLFRRFALEFHRHRAKNPNSRKLVTVPDLPQMVIRTVGPSVCLLSLMHVPGVVASSPQSKQEEEAEKSYRVRDEWLGNRPSLEGMRFSAHRLHRLETYPPELADAPEVYLEEETVQVDPRTTRTVIRAYRDDGYGRRRLVRVADETRHVREDGSEESTRKISQPDVNGRLQVQVEETQRVVLKGENEFEVQRVVSMRGRSAEWWRTHPYGGTVVYPMPRGSSSRLLPVEQFVQRERRQPDGTVDFELVHYTIDINRDWKALEQRTAVTRTVGEEVRTEEEVYRADGNRRMVLSAVVFSREWASKGAGLRRTIETRSLNPEGKLQLSERVSLTQTGDPDGVVQMVQDVEVRNQGNGRMQLLERIVSSSRQGEGGEVSTEFQVQAPNSSGRLETIRRYQETRSEVEGDGQRTRGVRRR